MLRPLISALLLAGSSFNAPASVGDPAPPFTLQSASGAAVSLDDYRGKHVVLEWTNHQCPFVRKHYDSGNMQRQQAEATDRDVVWLTVISSAPGKQGHVDADEARIIADENAAEPEAVLLDPAGDVGRAYGAKTTPHLFVVDPEGTMIYAGAIDSIRSADKADINRADQYVMMALNAVANDATVDPASTRPYGCSIKY